MRPLPEFLRAITGFEWDEGSSAKNWMRHGVTQAEAEQMFFNRPLVVSDDPKHSTRESRYFALGETDDGTALAVVFTFRSTLLRVISARPMSRKERRVYAQAQQG